MSEKSILEMVGGEKHINPHYNIKAEKKGVTMFEKEAEDSFNCKKVLYKWETDKHSYIDGYIDSAEPREKRIAELEKENAELKEKYVKNITDCDICDTYCNSQLTKAKDMIREFVEWATWQGSNCPNFKSIQDKAEQFLSEVEK